MTVVSVLRYSFPILALSPCLLPSSAHTHTAQLCTFDVDQVSVAVLQEVCFFPKDQQLTYPMFHVIS
jgi:hypothetical protein